MLHTLQFENRVPLSGVEKQMHLQGEARLDQPQWLHYRGIILLYNNNNNNNKYNMKTNEHRKQNGNLISVFILPTPTTTQLLLPPPLPLPLAAIIAVANDLFLKINFQIFFLAFHHLHGMYYFGKFSSFNFKVIGRKGEDVVEGTNLEFVCYTFEAKKMFYFFYLKKCTWNIYSFGCYCCSCWCCCKQIKPLK